MFIFNLKVNKNKLLKISIIIMLIIVLIILSIVVYKILFKEKRETTLKDTIKSNEIFEINSNNYTTILQAVNTNPNSYIGCKVHFKGYVYRVLDFSNTQFVLARDMQSTNNQSLIVGFLCEFKDANKFSDNMWVDITGEIVKSNYHGDIPIIKVYNMFETARPDDIFVSPPDNTYIDTNKVF